MEDEHAKSISQQVEDLAEFVATHPAWESAKEAGEIGEAISSGYVEVIDGGHLVDQHTTGSKPQGIDKVFLDEDMTPHFAEDKTIGWGMSHEPYMRSTTSGRQMDDEWIAANSGETQLEVTVADLQEASNGIVRDVFQIDIPADTFSRHEVDENGRVDSDPSLVFALSDVISAIDSDRADEVPIDFTMTYETAEELTDTPESTDAENDDSEDAK